jgi:uncharacterized protein YjiS (DUF1127 family)
MEMKTIADIGITRAGVREIIADHELRERVTLLGTSD